jgi:hypothetical protein
MYQTYAAAREVLLEGKVAQSHHLTYGVFNAKSLYLMRSELSDKNIPVVAMVCSEDVWLDMSNDTLMMQAITASSEEQRAHGNMGVLYGMEILSDCAVPPQASARMPRRCVVFLSDPLTTQ